MKLHDLFEATFDTSEIVDYLYNEVYAEYIENLQRFVNGDDVEMSEVTIKQQHFTPEALLDAIEDTKFHMAMEKTPIEVFAGVARGGSAYVAPLNGHQAYIRISFDRKVYNTVRSAVKHMESYEDVIYNLPSKQYDNIEAEINGSRLKSTISHEISHWMDDTFNNQHITKMAIKAKEYETGTEARKNILNRGQRDPYLTDYEINALIHGVKELKRTIGNKKWNTITFNDLFNLDPATSDVKNRLRKIDKKLAQQLFKSIAKRMARENLLGKNMTGTVNL